MKRILISFLILFFITGTVAMARDMKRLERTIEKDREIKTIHLESDIGAARFSITTHEGGDIFEASVRYDANKINTDIEFEKSGSSAELFLTSSQRRRKHDIDTDDNRWKTSLSTDYKWDIDLDIGFAESRIDLSDLPLSKLNVDVGASEMELEFKRPNPISLKRFTVNAGAGEIELLGLGYANFERLDFDGGAGEFFLDFNGMTEGRHQASIDAGVGELRIQLPENFPVRIEIDDSWLSSVEILGDDLSEVDDGIYETDDFDDRDDGLEINIDIGVGSVTIAIAGSINKRTKYRSRGILGQLWSLPAIPSIPVLPGIPAITALPDLVPIAPLASLPSLPALPTLSAMPPIPAVPAIPALPDLADFDNNSERSRRKVE